jgi:hypothetical protein
MTMKSTLVSLMNYTGYAAERTCPICEAVIVGYGDTLLRAKKDLKTHEAAHYRWCAVMGRPENKHLHPELHPERVK